MRAWITGLAGLTLSFATWAAEPVVIAHRGASGYLPEHTLAAYAMAYAQGADFVEPDLVLTRDGVLVARHEPRLDETTDVAARFPDRRAADGHFYAADLDWAEIAELRAVEYRDGRFPPEARLFPVPRFTDVLALVAGLNHITGCAVGLYPELKETAWHRARGLDPVAALRTVLARAPFAAELRIQSFEAGPLRELAAAPIAGAKLVQLVGDPALVTEEGLDAVAGYADGIGPWLGQLARAREAGDDLVARARARGLFVDSWTLRADDPAPFEDFAAATAFALDLGVDGLFTDHPDQLVAALGRQREITPCDR